MTLGSGYRWDCGTSGAADTKKAAIDTALGYPRQPTTSGPHYGGTTLTSACVQSGQYLSEIRGIAKPSGSTRIPRNSTTPQTDRVIDGVIGGSTDPFDIVIIPGQSNAEHRSEAVGDLSADISDAYQWRASAYADALSGERLVTKVSAANEPIDHTSTASGSSIGWAAAFARAYITDTLAPGRRLLLVCSAIGGTSLVASGQEWDPTAGRLGAVTPDPGYAYATMISRATAAATEIIAAFPGSAVVGVCWLQGESDAGFSVAGATYSAALDALIAAVREDLGISDLPWVVGTIPDDYTSGTATAIRAAIADTPNRVAGTACVDNTGRATHDGTHFTAASLRLIGPDYAAALAGLL